MAQRIVSDLLLSGTSWQAFERMVMRLVLARGFEHVRLAGTSGDGGADVIATKSGKRWLFQVKRWRTAVGPEVVAETLAATRRYEADIPVIVSKSGFAPAVLQQQRQLLAQGIKLQLWDSRKLIKQAELAEPEPTAQRCLDNYELRNYQSDAVDRMMGELVRGARSALVVLATGLGKTFVAAEFYRRFSLLRPTSKTLVLAHRNELVYQLERSFWPMLSTFQSTGVWNGYERPDFDVLRDLDLVFACVDSVASSLESGRALPHFDLVIVDECHHLGTLAYNSVLGELSAGDGGAFLVGMTATPWRPDGSALGKWFDHPVVNIDLVRGLREGYLANVDYRMYTDNVNWEALQELHGDQFSPRGINRTLFVDEWDDAVVQRLAEAWKEQTNPRAIVFCGTIDHAEKTAARINALAITRAQAIYSRSVSGRAMKPVERNKALWDFAEGRIGVLCAVDVLNEGVDVPDVNIVVFQRVTHSRRIFVQQLGRGLRLARGKDRVIVLDFVSDIRRFAAGLDLHSSLEAPQSRSGSRVKLGSKVTFFHANEEDKPGAQFLREWLGDLKAVEEAGEDVHILRYPPEYDHSDFRRG
ncbi:DEAD/DEAH box helicase family protein [Microbispora sp. H10836]|uniref:DEAD/DEAH box helicase family protein n=1 Tax=Microbispora sp. H10836 TaxID=2729106 RepID=UPI0014744F12|nr:DEAD/DEAH box helicase family protein [Microbispora sp. H10836]